MENFMIRVRMLGGLGNQLFQYFAAKRVQSNTGSELLFDFRWNTFGNVHPDSDIRDFSFFTQENVLQASDFTKISFEFHRVRNYVSRRSLTLGNLLRIDASGSREPFLNSEVGSGWSLERYYQTLEYYFGFIRNNPEFKFELRNTPSEKYSTFLDSLNHQVTIGVHVRGGDYKKLGDLYWHLDESYFFEAISYLKSKLPHAQVVIFSDDIQLARQLINIDSALFAPNLSPSESLKLMSECHGLVTANSTFSTWAAVTGREPKFVVSPKNWFSTSQVSNIRIPNALYL
jgi:hypothetical protein